MPELDIRSAMTDGTRVSFGRMLKAERGVRLCVGEYGRTSEASTTRAGAIGRKSWKSRRAVTKLPAEQTDG